MKGSVLLLFVGFGIEYFLQLSLNWRNFLILCVVDTFFYIFIMYKFCMNEYEKGLCKRVGRKILRIA